MAIPFTPHTVMVKKFNQAKSGRGVANNITYTDGPTLRVRIGSKDATEIFQTTRLEIDRPHKMMMDVEDADKVKPQDRIAWGSRLFVVKTPVRISQDGLPTDHASTMLEEIDA